MFKITKCENCVVCLRFALIATNRLKLGKVLKVIFAWIKVILFLRFRSMLVEIEICLLIVYRMVTFLQTKMQDGYLLNPIQ